MFACIGTREGFREVLETIEPLPHYLGFLVYFNGSFHRLPWRIPLASMEAIQLPWKLPLTSMEVNLLLPWKKFNFHGSFHQLP